MPKPAWEKVLMESADPGRTRRYWDLLLASPAGTTLRRASEEQVRVIALLLGASPHLSELLVAHPEWILHALNAALLNSPRQAGGLKREVSAWLDPLLEQQDWKAALAQLRLFKQREMLRIAARDISRLGTTPDIIQELSNVADVCLEAVWKILWPQFTGRFGNPWHRDGSGAWQPSELSIIALGKLGGQELNYSSDVDLIFVYTDEGFVFPARPRKSDSGKGLSNHQFFSRLAKEFITEVSRLTDEGFLYRMDVRLRPGGDSGPLVRSLDSYENYYAQWGQVWERMMLIKARPVAGSVQLGAEFVEMVQPFRHPRSINSIILDEIAAVKDRIETEVLRAGEAGRNVKLGHGGIREIEFIVQASQLMHAGRNPFLQGNQTIPVLQNLVRYNFLGSADARELINAYCFLRDVEHRLQMENNLQIHTIPTERKERDRLALLMGFENVREFEGQLHACTTLVRSLFDRLLKSEKPRPDGISLRLPSDFESEQDAWKNLLGSHGFRDVDRALQLMELFVRGPGYVHVSPRTSRLAMELVPRLLSYCPVKTGDGAPLPSAPTEKILSDPDRVLARLDSFIQAYGARSMLYETWTHNPSFFELLLLLFDRSEFLAELAIRTPDLVEDLQLSGRLRRQKSTAEILKDLAYGKEDEDQSLWLRKYHQAEQMRIGLRDILGMVDMEHSLAELTALADACIQYALTAVMQENRLKQAPFAIVALGKLGGKEINYGSDLDLVFVADDKIPDLPRCQKLAAQVLDILSRPTEFGIVFPTDARLRPDGEKGLLVNSLKRFDDYFRQRAQLWEIQAYTRVRTVAGDLDVGEEFKNMAAVWTDFRQQPPVVRAYSPDWKREIARMRSRIESERTPAGQEHLAIKTGAGGLMDAEFVAQMFALENGWQEANTLKVLLEARSRKKLALPAADSLIDGYRELRRIEGILRRWSFAGETVLPHDEAALYRVAVRCGFSDTTGFLERIATCRRTIRRVYLDLLGPG